MRYLLTLLMSVAFAATACSQVTNAEYFIDTDPGYRNGLPVIIAENLTITKDFEIALSLVNPGFHTLGLRAKDAQGRWSQTYLHSFYIFNSPGTNVSSGEYFIDTDPGYGNATVIPATIGSDSTVKYLVPLAAYAKGFHTIGIRFKDNGGGWSQTNRLIFYVEDNGAPVNIVSLQYYFSGDGATDSIYSYAIPAPSTAVDLNFTADLSQLTGDREYTMHIWAVNEKSSRSEVFMKKVKVCNGDPVNANFDFIPLGTQVSFIDSSIGINRKYKWDFGDGTIDSVSNPVHNYAVGGNYNVKMIVSNFCNADTFVNVVNVLKLQHLSPTVGGNKGLVTLIITGSGFTKESIVILTNANTEIIGDSILFLNKEKTSISVSFNLNNKELGFYDVLVKNGTSSDSLKKLFKIENEIPARLSVDIRGRSTIRAGRKEKYDFIITNHGNQDALFVPLWIGIPPSMKINVDFYVYRRTNQYLNLDSVPVNFITDTLFGNKVDSTNLYYFIIPKVAANSSFKCNVNLTGVELNESKITAWTFPPLIGISDNNAGRILAQQDEITYKNNNSFLDCILQETKETLDPFCAQQANDVKETLDKNPCNSANYSRALQSAIENNTALPVIDCSAEDNYFKTFVVQHVVEGFSYLAKCVGPNAIKQIGNVGKWVGRIITGKQGYNNLKNCVSPFIFNVSSTATISLKTVISLDPNVKLGPEGNTSENYMQGLNAFNYKIFFENKNTATAPAQEVIIIDTLDKSVFDLSTFQLQNFGFGDSSTYIPRGLAAYATSNLLKRTGMPDLSVRTDAKLDTSTGILKWRFLSIDPLTREFITDPLDGFLPPNVTSPQGEGFISYSIQPKASLPHGTQIKNKASIYFDNNDPIVTNEFLNTIDKQNPVSSVTGTPSEVYDTTFTVQWSGNDNGAGVRSYDVFYKVNNGEYQLWQYDVSLAENTFTGKKDSVYSFFSIAKDHAGNQEPSKATAERTVTIRAIDSLNKICPGANTSFLISNAGAGFTYQWQVNEGNDFADIQNNTVYSGSSTTQLNLVSPGTIYSNYQYRCKITNGATVYYSQVYTIKFENIWLGAIDSAWETAANWSCGLVPDGNTDVVIPKVLTATPVLNTNGTCKSITLNKDSNVMIKTGVNLLITGK